MNDFKTVILNILETIGFSDNKETFIAEFLKNIHLQSLLDLVETLTTDKQEELRNQLSVISDDQEKVSETLKKYFSEDQMQQSLKNAARDAISKYIQSISHTLSDSQRESLAQILEIRF